MSNNLSKSFFYEVDSKTTEEFDSRYAKGYMTSPRVVERKRISEVLKKIPGLPETGVALDFGCGKGDFTILLHEMLPNWQIVGLDISAVAIKKAKESHPWLEFYSFQEFQKGELKFDLIFSHHVLEYVPEIDYVLSTFEALSKENSVMLHVIPCGNHAGIEYKIASMVNGINPSNGLYFYEHSAHVRRYSETEFISTVEKASFKHRDSWFVDHYFGALEWITRSNVNFIKSITPLKPDTAGWVIFRLALIRLLLYLLLVFRYPYFNYDRAKRKWNWNAARKFFFIGIICAYVPSLVFNWIFLFIVDVEWGLRKKSAGGGKMYLLFTRR
ncbi:MAG: class I SAM-dependent methyltransferase [Cytophagales bacterium]|nr:class I SAM-dependent methyltransferase [Cytophagales bacterium]